MSGAAEDVASLKNEGNELFKTSKFEDAKEKYLDAIAQCELHGEEDDEKDEEIIDSKTKAALYNNLSACWFHLGNKTDECLEACDKALELDEAYDKARVRRIDVRIKIDDWQSLEKAVEDMKYIIDHSSDPKLVATMRKRLEGTLPKLKARQEEETQKMIGKLKEMGTGLLSSFGVDINNFKFNQSEDGSFQIKK